MPGEGEANNILCEILVHLSRFSEFKDEFLCPAGMTQHGIAEALRHGRSCISKWLKTLVDSGLAKSKLNHAVGRSRREKTFSLTPEGEKLASMVKREKAAKAAAMIDSELRKSAAEMKSAARGGRPAVPCRQDHPVVAAILPDRSPADPPMSQTSIG